MYNSFDVFDTLIGRLSFSGLEIFEIIEKKFNIVDFKKNRQNSETKGIDNIYKNLKKYYNDDKINWEEIKNYELQLEYDLSFPINKYLDLIEKNDILVSDMYLEEENIRKILNKHKKIDNKIYVETGHKSDCSFWKYNPVAKSIKIHYGDNKISDYKNAKKFNINAELITNIKLTETETKFIHIIIILIC